MEFIAFHLYHEAVCNVSCNLTNPGALSKANRASQHDIGPHILVGIPHVENASISQYYV